MRKNTERQPGALRGCFLLILLAATAFGVYVVIARPAWLDLPFLPPRATPTDSGSETYQPPNATPLPNQPTPLPLKPASPFGMNIQTAARYGIYGSQQIPLNAAREAGVTWDREEIRWDMVISQRTGNFDWGFSDEAINKALNRGISLLVLLAYNRDGSHTMPDLDAWSNYVKAVVERYKDRVKYWQVWNEPDDNNFLRGANPSDYARLLARTYTVIKAADPEAKVVTAGVSGFAVPWLEQMLAAGGTGKFDILAVHPYVNFPASPESKYWRDNQLGYFQAFAARNGNPPIWITEFGWPTAVSPNTVSESQQADYISRIYVMGLAAGVQKLFMYQFRDEGAGKPDNYGLVRPDWTTPKTSYGVYKNLTSRLEGAQFKQQLFPLADTRKTLEDFEQNNSWGDGYANAGASVKLAFSGEQKHGGNQALRVEYTLAQQKDSYIQFGREIAVAETPGKIGFWVYGDNSGAQLRLLIKDSQERLFYYEVGKVGSPGWRFYQANLAGEATAPSPAGQRPAFPVRLDSIQLTRQPDPNERALAGVIYFDDFYSESGAFVQAYRFEKEGKFVDIVWTEGAGDVVRIPARPDATQATLYTRNGAASTLTPRDGYFEFVASEQMSFLEQ